MADKAHTIILDIQVDGKVKGEVKGVAGKSCAPLSKWLDELGTVLEDGETADYRKPENAVIKVEVK